MKTRELKQAHIYSFTYGATQVVARFKEKDTTNYLFYSHLHYWNGYETYHEGGFSVTNGCDEIREATPSEKHNLIRNETANNTL